MKIEVFYDKQCPFCNLYSKYLIIKESHDLILLNARENIEELNNFKKLGFDIDEGFIVRVDNNKLYHGADAINFLNTITKRKLYFTNNKVFKNVIYPFVKSLRKALLAILGRSSDLLK